MHLSLLLHNESEGYNSLVPYNSTLTNVRSLLLELRCLLAQIFTNNMHKLSTYYILMTIFMVPIDCNHFFQSLLFQFMLWLPCRRGSPSVSVWPSRCLWLLVIGISSTAPRSKGPIVLVVCSQARPFQEESSSLRAIWLSVGGGEIYVPVNARMKRSEELFYTSASCQITPMVASNYQGPFLRWCWCRCLPWYSVSARFNDLYQWYESARSCC